jgi:hypothetical protein
VKKKAKLEWDELQDQVQEMEQVKWPLLVCLTFEILLGIIKILAWGVGFIPQSAWVHFEKDKEKDQINRRDIRFKLNPTFCH